MELLFETQLAITQVAGRLNFFQSKPEVLPEPVLMPGMDAPEELIQAGTVLRDGGRFRLWYAAFPPGPGIKRKSWLAYAESDNGLDWKRHRLDLVRSVDYPNNYCDGGFPSIFVDPEAPASHRYRAVGYGRPDWGGADPIGSFSSFYTAHSPDGLRWELDSPRPRWLSGDTITSVYHPAQRRGIAAMKFVRRANGMSRRAIWTADLRNGAWGDPVCALVPDEFDDVAALARGCRSTDYYYVGLLPAGSGTVGLLNNFRHTLPLSAAAPEHYAIYGTSDISLVYQARPGDRWLHAPGRRIFLEAGTRPWCAGWLGCAATVRTDREHLFFLSGQANTHAWHLDPNWQVREEWEEARREGEQASGIGVARLPLWRFFGWRSDPEGVLEVELGEISEPSLLRLNYAAPRGQVRVQLFARTTRADLGEMTGRSADADVVPLTGDALAEPVRWRQGAVIAPVQGRRIVARITLRNAAVYAWELRRVSDQGD